MHPLVPRELVRLAQDNDELVPWFQPVVSARTGKLTGCEIPMRQRVTRTAVSPQEAFIMQAEISGLIVPVTCRLMEKAKDRLLSVRDSLPSDFHISVNVTADCVLSPVFETACQRFLHSFGKYSPVTLVAELTERTPFPVTNDVRTALCRIRRAGVRIALDDFGTGCCGYSYLQAFPTDFVKVDKRFVQNAERDQVAGHVIDAVVSLSRKCGFRVTADGVETQAHASAMKKRGVDYLQGYLYSAPVDAESFIREWTGKE
ncbi:TPA: cyclic diguanylate phosphodiesterase [Escherichia coli]